MLSNVLCTTDTHVHQKLFYPVSMVTIHLNIMLLVLFFLFVFCWLFFLNWTTTFQFLCHKNFTFLQYLQIRSRSNYRGIFLTWVICRRPLQATNPITIFSLLMNSLFSSSSSNIFCWFYYRHLILKHNHSYLNFYNIDHKIIIIKLWFSCSTNISIVWWVFLNYLHIKMKVCHLFLERTPFAIGWHLRKKIINKLN